MNSNKIHDRIYYSYKRRKYIIVLLKYCINFQQIDLILCHPHHTKKSNSIYRNSKRFVVILLFNSYIEKMKNYWILRECYKFIFPSLTWTVDPTINLINRTHYYVRRWSMHLRYLENILYLLRKDWPKSKNDILPFFFSIKQFNNYGTYCLIDRYLLRLYLYMKLLIL